MKDFVSCYGCVHYGFGVSPAPNPCNSCIRTADGCLSGYKTIKITVTAGVDIDKIDWQCGRCRNEESEVSDGSK